MKLNDKLVGVEAMTDTLTPEQRHRNMSSIRGKDTAIEVVLRKKLFAKGFRFRKNVADLPGKPDIVLPKYKTVIFIHGCFWHRHEGCRLCSTPKTRPEFWMLKFDKNIERDKRETDELIKAGWHVLVVWECELKSNLDGVVNELEHILKDILPHTYRRLNLPGMQCFIRKE